MLKITLEFARDWESGFSNITTDLVAQISEPNLPKGAYDLPVDLLLDGLVRHDGDRGVLVVLPPREPRHYVRLARAHLVDCFRFWLRWNLEVQQPHVVKCITTSLLINCEKVYQQIFVWYYSN